ncbi:MAG: hypothetical protein K6G66_01550 [Oscillospiraceae bacterium]|nr:hypothetical protein [Oscillospiraceae bacterium]
MNKRRLLFRLGAVLVLLAIAACMMVIGRGHTIYLDNKTLEYEGTEYKAFYRATLYGPDGERISRLNARERGMTTNIGQSFAMTVGIIEQKDGDEVMQTVALKLPYNMDGVIVNIPAYLAGLPQEAWMSEFVATPSEAELEEDAAAEGDDILAGAEF